MIRFVDPDCMCQEFFFFFSKSRVRQPTPMQEYRPPLGLQGKVVRCELQGHAPVHSRGRLVDVGVGEK